VYIDLSTLTWPSAPRIQGPPNAIGLLPTAALEQHGPHLPLSTDILIAEELGRRIADILVEPVFVAPVLPGGLSSPHLAFPGVVDLPEAVFVGVLAAYVDAFQLMGITRVAIFSAHGGNLPSIDRFARERPSTCDSVKVIAYGDFDGYLQMMIEGARRAGLEPLDTDVHAGAMETSQMLASHPHLVRTPAGLTGYEAGEDGWLARVRSEGLQSLTANGVMGRPTDATPWAGEEIYRSLAVGHAAWIAEGLGATVLSAFTLGSSHRAD
jgi:creatinine amidohydrolase/Fe(II)-dependent formamide hydrolase-like protein